MKLYDIRSSLKKETTIAWICLIIAGLIEIVWAYFMKQSYGFTRPIPTIITAFFLLISFFMLERGIRVFGIGLSYAVFTGIGIAGTTCLGIIFFNDSISAIKLISLTILIIGIIGLKFCEKSDDENQENKDNIIDTKKGGAAK